VLVLWGSNARETHPIMFHHMLAGIRNGARLAVVDPRRTATAQWATEHLALDVGSDVALANAVAREIVVNDLHDTEFIEHATEGFDEFRASIDAYTLEEGERLSGVPAEQIRRLAHMYGGAERAIICWTLGITEHHNAVDNVHALINLALLCGHVGRYGSGLDPLRGQNNVQGGGDMGAVPLHLPGFQPVADADNRARFEAAYGVTMPSTRGLNVTEMLHAAASGSLEALYVIGENPAVSDADTTHVEHALASLDLLVVQEIFMTRTAELADVVLPSAIGWCEGTGTVTSSDRRVQRVRAALTPPPGVRDDADIVQDLARRLGATWWAPQTAEELWDEMRLLSPLHGGMRYDRLDGAGLQWPCPDEDHPGTKFLHARLWERPVGGRRAPFKAVAHDPPADQVDDEYPYMLTTGRRLDSYNTGVQSGRFSTPLRRAEALLVCAEDMVRLGLSDGERIRLRSRRGEVEVPVRTDETVRPGLVFMTPHFYDEVKTNLLTINATDPVSGTAEFKATAVSIERLR
jgi:formate dehydrogenase major subunit